MEALAAMRNIWPSAGRALELLIGAKTNLDTGAGVGSSAVISGSTTVRGSDVSSGINSHKRKSHPEEDERGLLGLSNDATASAEEYAASVRSSEATQVPQSSVRRQTPRNVVQATQYRPMNHQERYGDAAGAYAIQPPSLLTNSYPWAEAPLSTSNGGPSSLISEDGTRSSRIHPEDEPEPAGPLSTSVLPQLYSTGLVDEPGYQPHPATPTSHQSQTQAPHEMHSHPQYHQHYPHSSKMPTSSHVQSHQSHPEYWSDYSTFSQLGSADVGSFNNIGVGGVHQGMPNSQHSHLQPQPQMMPPHSQANLTSIYIPPASYDDFGECCA